MYEEKIKFRNKIVDKIKNLLLHRSAPRFQMSIIVLFTAAGGFFTSYLLLLLGVNLMSLRYAFAVLVAYLIFIAMVRLWLKFQKKSLSAGIDGADVDDGISVKNNADADKKKVDVDIDPLDVVDFGDGVPIENTAVSDFAGGGDFGGGGASSSFAESAVEGAADGTGSSIAGSAAESAGGGIGIDIDLDGCLVIFLPLVAVLACFIAAGYIIYASPSLLAEVLLDGALSVGLYRRLKKLDKKHWLETVVAKTFVIFLIVFIVFIITGAFFQHYAPEANSIGDVWDKFIAKK